MIVSTVTNISPSMSNRPSQDPKRRLALQRPTIPLSPLLGESIEALRGDETQAFQTQISLDALKPMRQTGSKAKKIEQTAKKIMAQALAVHTKGELASIHTHFRSLCESCNAANSAEKASSQNRTQPKKRGGSKNHRGKKTRKRLKNREKRKEQNDSFQSFAKKAWRQPAEVISLIDFACIKYQSKLEKSISRVQHADSASVQALAEEMVSTRQTLRLLHGTKTPAFNSHYQEIVQSSVNFSLSLHKRAFALSRNNEFDEAEKLFDVAMKLMPDELLTDHFLGSQIVLNQIENLEKLAKHTPSEEQATVWRERADTCIESACKRIDTFFTSETNNEEIVQRLALISEYGHDWGMGRLSRIAIPVLQTAQDHIGKLDLGNTDQRLCAMQIYLALAHSFANKNKYANALAEIDKAEVLSSQDPSEGEKHLLIFLHSDRFRAITGLEPQEVEEAYQHAHKALAVIKSLEHQTPLGTLQVGWNVVIQLFNQDHQQQAVKLFHEIFPGELATAPSKLTPLLLENCNTIIDSLLDYRQIDLAKRVCAFAQTKMHEVENLDALSFDVLGTLTQCEMRIQEEEQNYEMLIEPGLALLQLAQERKKIHHPATTTITHHVAIAYDVQQTPERGVELLTEMTERCNDSQTREARLAQSMHKAFRGEYLISSGMYERAIDLLKEDSIDQLIRVQDQIQHLTSLCLGNMHVGDISQAFAYAEATHALAKDSLIGADRGTQKIVGNCYYAIGRAFIEAEEFDRVRELIDWQKSIENTTSVTFTESRLATEGRLSILTSDTIALIDELVTMQEKRDNRYLSMIQWSLPLNAIAAELFVHIGEHTAAKVHAQNAFILGNENHAVPIPYDLKLWGLRVAAMTKPEEVTQQQLSAARVNIQRRIKSFNSPRTVKYFMGELFSESI